MVRPENELLNAIVPRLNRPHAAAGVCERPTWSDTGAEPILSTDTIRIGLTRH
jgi:hypothetical protein